MSTYILWDIDGTLIYNTPTAGGLYIDAIEHVTGVRPTVAVEDPHGMTEGQLLAAILEVNGLDGDLIGDVLYHLDVLSREQHERGLVRDACVGADAAIEAVAQRGWINALLTGNGPNRARYKLLAAGFDPEDFDWDHSYFGHESPTRHHLTAGARSALAGHNAFIIGDTPTDGRAADSAGIPFLAVATGVYSVDELRATSALVVADDLQGGLDEVLGAIDGVLPDEQTDGSAPADSDSTDSADTVFVDADSEGPNPEVVGPEDEDSDDEDSGEASSGDEASNDEASNDEDSDDEDSDDVAPGGEPDHADAETEAGAANAHDTESGSDSDSGESDAEPVIDEEPGAHEFGENPDVETSEGENTDLENPEGEAFDAAPETESTDETGTSEFRGEELGENPDVENAESDEHPRGVGA